jgi:hypothetical protein
VVAENLIYFEDLALSLGKDKKSFFHGVHKRRRKAEMFFFASFLIFRFWPRKEKGRRGGFPL